MRALVLVCLLGFASPSLAGPAPQDLEIAGIEVTQAIQVYDLADPGAATNNSVPLVQGNHTVARVYLRAASGAPIGGVTGRLRVWEDGELAADLQPDWPGFAIAMAVPDREEWLHALAFTLPLSLGGEDVDLLAEVDPLDVIAETDEANNELALDDLAFVVRHTPEIVYTPINYQAFDESDPTTIGMPEPDRIAPGEGDQMVFGIYPFPDHRSRYHVGNFPAITMIFDLDFHSVGLLNLLKACREFIVPPPEFLYGWVRENPYYNNGSANGVPGIVAFGNTQIVPRLHQRTLAHELGHLFGLEHNLRTLAPEVGYDVEDLVELGGVKPSSLFDILVAGELTPSAWIDTESYLTLLDSPVITSASVPPTLDRYILTGSICSAGSGSLDPLFRLASPALASGPDIAGAPRVLVLDSAGGLLGSFGFQPEYEDDGTIVNPCAPFALTIPATGGEQVFRLLDAGGTTLAERTRSASAPAVTLLSPATGSTLAGLVTVAWSASDGDSDQLTFAVRYSPDAGATWVPLAVGLTTTSADFDVADVAGGEAGIIEVLASDGVNTSTDRVTDLVVPRKAPRVHLVRPRPGDTLALGSLVTLSASVFDFEERFLPDSSLTWDSDVDGLVGRGATVQADSLSAGPHTLTLTATDGDGNAVQECVAITVVGEIGAAYCFGDGTGAPCPCGNDSGTPDEGCVHSGGRGMTISGAGSASVAADDLVLTAEGCPPGNTGIFYSGKTRLAPGSPLYDGLQCAGGDARRYQGRFQTSGTVSDTGFVAQDPSGTYFVPGVTVYFQYWSRDVARGASPCGTGAGFSPGYAVRFGR